MAKQRDAERKVKDAEKAKREEEERKQAEEDAKFGNKIKASLGNAGNSIKNAFVKTDQKLSQAVDGKHKSNGGVAIRDDANAEMEKEVNKVSPRKSPRK